MDLEFKCPKCQSSIYQAKTKAGMGYHWCPSCKGILILKDSLPEIYQQNVYIKQLVKLGLKETKPTQMLCPTCPDEMLSGKVFDSQLTLEECAPCETFFFDKEEFSKLFRALEKDGFLQPQKIEIDESLIMETEQACPVCKDYNLFGIKGKFNFVSVCIECGGMATKIENLERVLNKSLFAPEMFTEREGRSDIAICRSCREEQSTENDQCRKCNKDLVLIDCISCDARMNEYDLSGIVIDRCQFCNDVWLDDGEFEKIFTAMPDLRRHYERVRRQAELTRAATRGATHAYMVGVDVTKRKIMDRTGVIYKMFSLNYY